MRTEIKHPLDPLYAEELEETVQILARERRLGDGVLPTAGLPVLGRSLARVVFVSALRRAWAQQACRGTSALVSTSSMFA